MKLWGALIQFMKYTSFFNLTLTWSHLKGASSPAAKGELLVCPWWRASSSGLTGDSTCRRTLRRSSVWINASTFSTESLVPHMLPFIPSGASIMPPETRWLLQLGEEWVRQREINHKFFNIFKNKINIKDWHLFTNVGPKWFDFLFKLFFFFFQLGLMYSLTNNLNLWNPKGKKLIFFKTKTSPNNC